MTNHWDRKARQLLLSPQGRAALKQFGIDVELVGNGHKPNSEPAKDKPIVAILCPTYRSPEPRMTDALMRMVQYTRSKDCCVVYSGPPIQAGIVHWARNALIAEQIKSGKPWTHVLFIDDDIVVPENALEKLLSHKKDIVAGLCVRRTDPPMPNIRYFDQQVGDAPQIWEWPENELIEVDGAGTGLMLISQHALEQIAQAYFDCLYERDFYGMSDEKTKQFRDARMTQFDKDHLCYWFRFLPSTNRRIEMGEDIGFCFIAKRYCGLKVYVDTSVQPGHLGPYSYAIKDFLPYRDWCIERAKAEGTYKPQPRIEAEVQIVG